MSVIGGGRGTSGGGTAAGTVGVGTGGPASKAASDGTDGGIGGGTGGGGGFVRGVRLVVPVPVIVRSFPLLVWDCFFVLRRRISCLSLVFTP